MSDIIGHALPLRRANPMTCEAPGKASKPQLSCLSEAAESDTPRRPLTRTPKQPASDSGENSGEDVAGSFARAEPMLRRHGTSAVSGGRSDFRRPTPANTGQ